MDQSGDMPDNVFEEQALVAVHGETVVLRITATGGECPVCAFDRLTKPAYLADASSGHAVASFEYCPCCDTQFGWDDKIAPDAPKDALQRRWSELRRKWLQTAATETERQRCESRFGQTPD